MKLRGLLIFLCFAALPLAATAAWEPVMADSLICDPAGRVCFQGRIDFEPNQKVIEIRGRLTRTAGPGMLVFEFTGETPLNEAVFHSADVPVRGNYSESISHKFGPPYSNQTHWSLYRISFRPTP